MTAHRTLPALISEVLISVPAKKAGQICLKIPRILGDFALRRRWVVLIATTKDTA